MSWQEFSLLSRMHPLYTGALVFFATYPIVSSIVRVTTAIMSFFQREWRQEKIPASLSAHPPVSVLIPSLEDFGVYPVAPEEGDLPAGLLILLRP